jgi:osmotically-inducible protein OsmY
MKKQNIISLVLAVSLGIPAVMAVFTGCASDTYNRSTGEYIDDQALTARVNNALDDNPQYKFAGIEVKSFRGMVQLSGFVNTEELKTKAGEITKKVQGVREVENNITVKPTLSSYQ